MRKLLMLVTMLLVPALASAWTLPVKVTNTTAGINAGNGTTLGCRRRKPRLFPSARIPVSFRTGLCRR